MNIQEAKAHLSEVGTFVARSATEVHGGMGFTDLLGLHYWFKRIGFNRQVLGAPERLREEAARAQGWGHQPSRIAQQGGGYRVRLGRVMSCLQSPIPNRRATS